MSTRNSVLLSMVLALSSSTCTVPKLSILDEENGGDGDLGGEAGDGDGDLGDTGGKKGSGGEASSGGAPGSGGGATTGGESATGGVPGSGGDSESGGSGGSEATGGSTQSGTVGTLTSPAGDFERVKVVAGGEQYIIRNNNWGSPQTTNLILNYTDNSFTLSEGVAPSLGSGQPASFPSIYIGANGDTAEGDYDTRATDNLPLQTSTISSVQSSVSWSGSTESFATKYELWFSASLPAAAYTQATSGMIEIWLHDPAAVQPIGSIQANVEIAGRTWTVWSGVFSGRPVVTFAVSGAAVNQSDYNLKNFITAAASYGFNQSWYLTDVFFGFEIWSGGAGGNLSVDSFTCVVE